MKQYWLAALPLFFYNISFSQTYFSKLIGLPPPYVNGSYSAVETPDSGYICTLVSFNYLQDTNKVHVVRLDKAGGIVWHKTYGLDHAAYEVYEIIPTKDSCYVFCGIEEMNDTTRAILFKINPMGDSIWMQRYNDGARLCYLAKLKQTSDGGFVATGASERLDSLSNQSLWRQLYIVKTDNYGNLNWQINYGSPAHNENGSGIIETPNHNFISVGHRASPYILDFYVDALIVGISYSGQITWTKLLSDPLHDQVFYEIIPSINGDYLLAGGFSNKDEVFPNDIYGGGGILTKMGEQGNMLWYKKFEDETGDAEYQDIVQLSDGAIVTAGYRYVPLESPSLMKFNEDGELIWWRNYDYNPNNSEAIFSVTHTFDKGFLLAGYAVPNTPGPNSSAGWLLKVDSMGCEIPMCVVGTEDPITEQKQDKISVYPNPFQDKIFIKIDNLHITETVRFTFSNAAGITVQTFVEKITGLNIIETNNLPVGFYFLQIETGTSKFVEKLVKME